MKIGKPRTSIFWKHGYRTIEDILDDVDLCYEIINFFDIRFRGINNIKADKHYYHVLIDERSDDVITFLEELGLVKIDWDAFHRQIYKQIGFRTIEFDFEGKKIISLLQKLLQKQKRENIGQQEGVTNPIDGNVNRASKRGSKIVYWIERKKTAEIILNNCYYLCRPNFMGENDRVIEYIICHPDREITKREIEDATKSPLKKKIDRIVRDLRFTEELLKLFFPRVSKEGLLFTNNITEKDFEGRQIDRDKLRTQIKKLRRFGDPKSKKWQEPTR